MPPYVWLHWYGNYGEYQVTLIAMMAVWGVLNFYIAFAEVREIAQT